MTHFYNFHVDPQTAFTVFFRDPLAQSFSEARLIAFRGIATYIPGTANAASSESVLER